jgi:hypothetical protein
MPSNDSYLTVKTDIEETLKRLGEADKKLVTGFRRAVRQSGDAVIRAAGDVLDNESPGALTASEFTSVRGAVEGRAGSRPRDRNTRQAIKAGLKTRLSVSKTRGASVRVVTTTGQPAKGFNAERFRHAVFGNDAVKVGQKGTRFFKRGAEVGGKEFRQELQRVVRETARDFNQSN